MAGERKGRACEAIVVYALEHSGAAALRGGRICWNKPIPGQSVIPDVWIASPKHPVAGLFMVTHSAAVSASEKKFWRNVGEIAEAKLLLTPAPRVVSVVFDNSVKASLPAMESRIFAAYVEIPALAPHHSSVLRTFSEALASTRNDAHGLLLSIPQKAKASKDVVAALAWLSAQLAEALDGKFKGRGVSQPIWGPIVQRIRRRSLPTVPEARITSVRRGLGKLLIAEDPVALIATKRVRAQVPAYLEVLGLTKKTIAGQKLVDPDVLGALDLLGQSTSLQLCAPAAEHRGLQAILRPLRCSAESAPAMQAYVTRNWKKLTDTTGLFESLVHTHKNPAGALGLPSTVQVRPGWLFLFLSAMLKAHSGRRQVFGNGKLIKRISELDLDQKAEIRRLGRQIGIEVRKGMRAPRSIEYGMRDWFYGEGRADRDLRDFELLACASVLVRELVAVPASAVESVARQATAVELAEQVENVLIPYNMFQPLKALAVGALRDAGLPFEVVPYFPNPLAEWATSCGKRMNARAGGTEVIRCKNSLIRWVSVTDKGKDHKRKEFSGKAALLQITYEQSGSRFAIRPDVTRLVLVVDGTFNSDDLRALQRIGWDVIVYPDEMDVLVKAIV